MTSCKKTRILNNLFYRNCNQLTRMQYCYAIYSSLDNRTYAGYTTDPRRRIRQHNQQISGGAAATVSRAGLWAFLFVVACPAFDRHSALSFEWHIKRIPRIAPTSDKRLRGIPRRLACLRWALSHPKFARYRNAITVYACDAYLGDTCCYLSDLPIEIDVQPLSAYSSDLENRV